MLRRLFKKQNEVEGLMLEYIEQFKKTRQYFQEAMEATCSMCTPDTLSFLTGEVHKYESKADEILSQLANLMFGRALLPDVRNRIMQLMYSMDRIPEVFKRLLLTIRTQRQKIPSTLSGDFTLLVSSVCLCTDLLTDQFVAYLKKEDTVQNLLTAIWQEESHCDYQEEFALQRIFDDDDISPVEKLQLKEIIHLVGHVANLSEDISNEISILYISRSF